MMTIKIDLTDLLKKSKISLSEEGIKTDFNDEFSKKKYETYRRYYDKHKEVIKEKRKEYREKNKNKIKERASKKVECAKCGKEITKHHLKRHTNSKNCNSNVL